MSTLWYISQAFALVALVLVLFTFKEKSIKKSSLFTAIGYFVALIGLIFLKNIPAIVASIVAVVIETITVLEHFGLPIKRWHKYLASAILFAFAITLDIIFFEGFVEIIVMMYSFINLLAFLQSSQMRTNNLTMVEEVFGILHYILLIAPINAIIEAVILVRSLIATITLVKRKKELENEVQR